MADNDDADFGGHHPEDDGTCSCGVLCETGTRWREHLQHVREALAKRAKEKRQMKDSRLYNLENELKVAEHDWHDALQKYQLVQDRVKRAADKHQAAQLALNTYLKVKLQSLESDN